MSYPDLSVIIVSYNTLGLLAACLRALTKDGGQWTIDRGLLSREIVVIDNASADDSTEMVARDFPGVRLIRNAENLGFAKANNQGLAASSGRYALLLNSDTVVPAGALARLVVFMDAHPEAGACSPRLLRHDGTPQPYAFGCDPTLGYLLRRGLKRLLFRRPLHDWTANDVMSVDWVSGACLLARRAAVDRIGGLDEQIFMYFEDNDWCLRMRQDGWKVYLNPRVEIIHMGGQSVARNPAVRAAYFRSLVYFYGKHYGPIAQGILKAALAIYPLAARPQL